MVEVIDYYGHWNEAGSNKRGLFEREKIALNLVGEIKKDKQCFLDLGCGSGVFMQELKKRFPSILTKGIDNSSIEVRDARKKGLDVKKGNIERGIKEKNNFYDIIYAGEIIEHLFNPDYFLEEINRILKEGGYFILTTPNLCAWFNRIFLLFGIQPLFIEPSTKSKLIGAGILKRFKKDSHPMGHVRIFTLSALKDLLKSNGFKILKIKGAIYEEGLPAKMLWLDKIFKIRASFASRFVIIATKEYNL